VTDSPVEALREFAREANNWVCGDLKAFALEVDYKLLDESDGAFRQRRVKYTTDTVIIDCEWQRAGGTLPDLYRDFYSAYGEWIADESQFIQCVPEKDGLVFNLVVGSPTHVHLLQLRVLGPYAQQIVANQSTRGKHPRARRS
jgi:hypothetical protein